MSGVPCRRPQTFSEIAFRVTPLLLPEGLVFSVVMGLVGGFFPAWRASRMPVIQALRQELVNWCNVESVIW